MTILLLLILIAAVAFVMWPPAGRKKGASRQKATAEPAVEPKPAKRARRAFKFSFSLSGRNVARAIVGALQAILGVAILVCAAIFYDSAARLAQEGYDGSVATFVQLWLGVMLVAAAAAFATGYYTYKGRPRMVRIFGTVEILLAVVFLLPGTWLWPVPASLVVAALCSIIGVGKVTPAYRPVFRSHRFGTTPEKPATTVKES